MGTTRGDFFKYPRTPHLAGSEGTSDDKRLGPVDTARMLNDPSLIIEEKLDGTNVGIHFMDDRLVLQCRGHEITAGMHPQYDLFKQWATTKRAIRLEILPGTGVQTVPVLHQGSTNLESLQAMISTSRFCSEFENPFTHQNDNLMEGIYIRTEANGIVTARAKFVRPEFTEKVKQSSHWQYEKMIPNQLADSADIWS